MYRSYWGGHDPTVRRLGVGRVSFPLDTQLQFDGEGLFEFGERIR